MKVNYAKTIHERIEQEKLFAKSINKEILNIKLNQNELNQLYLYLPREDRAREGYFDSFMRDVRSVGFSYNGVVILKGG